MVEIFVGNLTVGFFGGMQLWIWFLYRDCLHPLKQRSFGGYSWDSESYDSGGYLVHRVAGQRRRSVEVGTFLVVSSFLVSR